jgi:hypothetical protein
VLTRKGEHAEKVEVELFGPPIVAEPFSISEPTSSHDIAK